MSQIDEDGPRVVREPYMVVVEWADPERNAKDEDAPFCFGPYGTHEEAKGVVDLINAYQDRDNDPPEERLTCRIGTYKAPNLLRMFLAL